MRRTQFALNEEPETRRPSKVRVTFMLLLVVLLVLSVTFIALYVMGRNKSDESTSKNGTVIPGKPTRVPATSCNSPACIISAAGMYLQICSLDAWYFYHRY